MKKQHLIPGAILCGLMLVFVANPASAGDGFSIGASAVRANVNVREAGSDIKGDSNGYRVFGVYMFNKNFGIEAGISSFGAPDDIRIPVNMEVESEAYDVYAVAAYPMTERLGIVAKAGFASWTTETEVTDIDAATETERNFRSTDLGLSLGGQYDVSKQFSIRTEFQWFDAATTGAENLLSVSAVFRIP
jgi:hypothetical protein